MGKDRTKKIKQLIKENRPSKLKSYVKKHRIDLNGIMLGKERSLLHFCCKCGTGDTFRYLSKSVQNIRAEDRDGNTALHLALIRANKNPDQSSEVYTDIILPLIQMDASLLEMTNQDDISCRDLLNQLVAQRQRGRAGSSEERRMPSFNCEEPSWEDKLREEMEEDEFQSWGRYGLDTEDDKSYGESYDEWTNRIRKEYHQKKSEKYMYQSSSKSDEKSSKSHKRSTDPELEKARESMRKKYEENQRRDRENYIIHKKKVYTEKWSKLLKSNEDDILTYSDIPWPFKKEISEMKTLLFCDIDVKSDNYRKYLRELQKQWHPDKFVQKLGHRLKPEEREEILNKVKEISQELNKWSESSME